MTMNKEQEFTKIQFYGDITDNVNHLQSDLKAFSNGKKLFFHLSEAEDVNAKVQDIEHGNQYLVTHFAGLANQLHRNSISIADQWERLFPYWTGGTRDFIARAIAGCSSEMVFWHEYAHIVGGHMQFLKSQGIGTGLDLYEVSPETNSHSPEERRLIRFVETDADIYGAQYLWARVMSVINAKKNQIPEHAWIAMYTLGIRSMYDAIHTELEDDFPEEFNHPHSLARAYGAISHGIEAASRSGLPEDECEKWRGVAYSVLLAYELERVGTPPSPETLEKFIKEELTDWNIREKELTPFRIKPISQKNKLSLIWKRYFEKFPPSGKKA